MEIGQGFSFGLGVTFTFYFFLYIKSSCVLLFVVFLMKKEIKNLKKKVQNKNKIPPVIMTLYQH